MKTLALTTPDGGLPAALPGHADCGTARRPPPPGYAAWTPDPDPDPDPAERPAALDMQPGGVCPLSADRSAGVVLDESLTGAGRIHCGSVEIPTSEPIAAIPDDAA